MEIDVKNALQTIRPDKLVQAEAHIEHVRRLIQFSTNIEKTVQAIIRWLPMVYYLPVWSPLINQWSTLRIYCWSIEHSLVMIFFYEDVMFVT